MNTEPTLVIGLGAMKSGTTWLHEYFASHPQFFASPIKEMNFFTSHLRNDCYPHIRRGFVRRLKQHVSNFPDEPSPAYSEKLKNLSDRVHMDYHPESYVSFFTQRMDRERCFGEISPSYADLDEDDFAFINDTHPKTKYILIMRDPVERYVSHLKFDKKLNPARDLDRIKQAARDPNSVYMRRSRYDLTIRRLERTIAQDDIAYLFYEEMFNPESIRRLCDFLGIDYHRADFSHQSNRNNMVAGEVLSAGERRDLRRALDSTYAFCRDRFGSTLPTAWDTTAS